MGARHGHDPQRLVETAADAEATLAGVPVEGRDWLWRDGRLVDQSQLSGHAFGTALAVYGAPLGRVLAAARGCDKILIYFELCWLRVITDAITT